MIGRQVRYLADVPGLRPPAAGCGRPATAPTLLRREDGLDLACEMIAEALPQPLRETAYALACEVAAADGALTTAELEVLELLRRALKVDRLVAAAIERAAYARHATL